MIGALAIAVSLAVMWLGYASGLAHGLQRWWIAEDVMDPMPPAAVWSSTAAWMLLCFVATAYFAAAAQRAGWAVQAGVPGFFAATLLWGSDLRSWIAGGLDEDWPAALEWVALLALGLVPLLAARSAWPRRAAIASRPTELVRSSPTAGQRVLNAIAHLILVALPIGIVLARTRRHLALLRLRTLGGPIDSVARLRRARPALDGWSSAPLHTRPAAFAGLLALGITGVGAILWSAVRPHLADTRRPRVALPSTLALTAVIAMIFVPIALGGLRFARAWDIVAPDDVEIVIDGQHAGFGRARGVAWGPRIGPSIGLYQTGSSRSVTLDEAHRGVLRGADLDRSAPEPSDSHLPPIRVSDVFGPDRAIEFRRAGARLTVRHVDVFHSMLSFRAQTHLRVQLAD